jgi:hypothetical protein
VILVTLPDRNQDYGRRYTAKGLMEVPMVKTTLIVVATAIPAFGGFWTEATVAELY